MLEAMSGKSGRSMEMRSEGERKVTSCGLSLLLFLLSESTLTDLVQLRMRSGHP